MLPEVFQSLQLVPHSEGGYYRRTYCSDHKCGERAAMSSIYYGLTRESPVGHWHRVNSDIIHYFHAGGSMRYRMLDAAGNLTEALLGPGNYQLLVKSGIWKCSELLDDEYGLLSEAVSPAFGDQFREFADADDLVACYPRHAAIIRRFAKR